MDTVLFYTFSTISQTLAGAIALIGAVVLYRLQILDSQKLVLIRELLNEGRLGDVLPRFREAHRTSEYEAAFEAFDRFVAAPRTPTQMRVPQEIKDARARLGATVDGEKNLRRAFSSSLRLTVGLILASVIALATTRAIAAVPYGPAVALVLASAAFIACLRSYVALFRTAALLSVKRNG